MVEIHCEQEVIESLVDVAFVGAERAQRTFLRDGHEGFLVYVVDALGPKGEVGHDRE